MLNLDRHYQTQADLRRKRVELGARLALALCGGMCGLAFFIFVASFIGLLPA